MKTREEVLEVLYQALRELNELLPPGGRFELSPSTVLIGPQGGLDSLGVVNFIAGVEQAVQDRFQVSVTLSPEGSSSSGADAWATVGSLADHLLGVVNAKLGSR